MIHSLEEILKDLKAGKPIILVDDENRENEGDIVFAAEDATYDLVALMVNKARGLLCVPLSLELANQLNLRPMVQNNTDPHYTNFTISVDSINTSTGISIKDRLETILGLSKTDATADDFRKPGHIFPLIAKEGGVLERPGHTEGIIDLLKLAGKNPIGVICEILNTDGTMARLEKDLIPLAKELGLKIFSINELKRYRQKTEIFYTYDAKAKLPTLEGDFDIHVFKDPFTGLEHTALSMGNLAENSNLLVRLHSSCLTGDAFHSLKCDCGDQLTGAMQMIAEKQEGIILYLNQEGRGIGLTNKIRAYALQEKGMDTIESNLALGFAADLRDYTPAVQMLKILKIKGISLITNNPDKLEGLANMGIVINERVPSIVVEKKQRIKYLETKKEKMGHLLN